MFRALPEEIAVTRKFIVYGSVIAMAVAVGVRAQQAPAPGGAPAQAPAGRAGGGGRGAASDPAAVLWAAFDANPKDGFVTGAEVRAAFDAWYAAADTAKSGSVTQAQLTTALTAMFPPPAAPAGGAPGGGAPGAPGAAGGRGAGRGFAPFVAGATTPGLNDRCGGRSQTPTVACPEHVAAMIAALPATAPAKPVKAHKVLAWSRIPSAGFQHSSIPLAIKAIEELGKKTGAWTTDVSWDPAAITAANLKQYDAIFLSSTTGCFFDMAPEADTPDARAAAKKTTDERRAAFLEFVRSGKGVAGIHATGDSYHSPCPNDDPAAGGRGGFGGGRGGGGGAGATLASVILRWSWGLNDKKLQANDQNLTKADMEAVADGWWGQLDPNKATLIPRSDFDYRIVPVITQSNSFVGSPGRDAGRGSWPDWDNMIGGWFKFHWLDPQRIPVKIDDKVSPLTKMFNGADFDVNDETYTFSVNSFSRENVHVLTSINYDKMGFMDKLKESNPRPDHDFGLSWIRKEGQGRLFYMALGHDERIYAMKPMMEHLLAGMQYALGDLKADDTPSKKK
jgi:type 1 glutamine amidotransferase